MNSSTPSPEYEARLRSILQNYDWQGLRDFSREHNQVPDDVYAQDQHFWEVLMHKLICNRIDTMAQHESSRKWLSERGYTADLGGY
jgi:hypothetical protein